MKRQNEFDANRYLRETRHRPPQRRSTDRDYSRLLTVAADVALTCGIVALAYFFADWLASVVVAL